MSATAKPIETRYAGHRFRSRLEARVAVFLDTAAGSSCVWYGLGRPGEPQFQMHVLDLVGSEETSVIWTRQSGRVGVEDLPDPLWDRALAAALGARFEHHGSDRTAAS